jgi:hypothetical protein
VDFFEVIVGWQVGSDDGPVSKGFFLVILGGSDFDQLVLEPLVSELFPSLFQLLYGVKVNNGISNVLKLVNY